MRSPSKVRPRRTDSDPAELFLATFPEGNIRPKPAFLSYQRAAGVRAEAISAAICIRTWLDDKNDPLPPEDILVVAPQADAYTDSVQEVFSAFGIPLRVEHRRLATTGTA